MKKILILLALLVAMTLVFVACQENPQPPVDDTTVADQPTEEPTQGEEDPTEAPDTDPETPEPGTDEPDEPTTPAPDTQEPDTPAPDTQAPETPAPETEDPMEPVNVFDAEDIQTVTGGDPSNMTQDCLTLEEGYIHVVPIGPDPYWYPFAGVDGARYVAIRYRTDATGADMQLYMSSTGNGPTDDTTMIRQPVIADGEWHVIIFDTQSLIDAGKYDGEYVSYFRFDPLEAGYKLDENGEPYKEESGQWARYSLPEGCMIDVAYIGFFHCEEAVAKYDFEQYPPYAQPGESGLKGVSFDTFYLNGQMYFPEDGQAGSKLDAINNTLTFASAAELENITLRGWIGFDQAIDAFGYYVDNYEFVYGEFKTPTDDGVLAAGGEHATRFEIFVDLSYLEGDDHFVGFVVKLADGTIVQLREDITIDLPELPKDITDSFTSDVNANEVGTTMDASDLGNFFVTELPLAGSGVEANGEGKLYHLTSINDMYADVNGRYFFKANVINSDGAGWMFARGYKVVNSDEIVEKFDPAGGFYKINNYYETDSAGAMGGAGIYARLSDGKLFIMVKYYNPETITRVGNKIYAINAAGTELTLADNGSKVSVLVDGVTYATIELSGSIAYGDINEVEPAGEFAEKAVITLKDGTTETIENTLIAATCECQVGIVARAGSFKFDALAVGGYSAIEVPALEIVTPEEPPVVDPNAPVLMLTPEFINSQAGSAEATVANNIGSHEIITEDGVTFVRLTSNGGDPYVALANLGSYLELPPYMAFAYRTNCDLDAHVFIGSGSGWNGQGDVASVAWNQDNNWNLAVLDLNNAGLTSIQNGIISYCRFDFFTGNGAGNMDVEYVAFFNSAEAAQKYFDKLHGGADEPDAPVAGGAADFNTIVTPNANGDSSYKNTYTTENGWVSENSAIQTGGANNSNPQYTVIGPDNTYKAICMNGKVGVAGKITSPTLSGGISKLVLTYTKMFTDTKLSVTITITDLATGATYTRTVARDVDKDTDKYVVWTDEWVLETPITGDFTIELVNDCPSNNTSSNKDRITILGITWEGAAAEEPETPDEPAANEIPVTTTDNYTWVDVVEFTATVSGTYTFTLPAGLGAFDVTACDTWPPVPGTAPYVDYYDNAEGATFSIELAAGETTRFYIGSTTKADWVITWTVVEGEVGGGEEPDPEEPSVEDVVLVVGDNEINVTEDMKAQGGFNATITVEADGDYKFSSNYLLVRIYNNMGMMLGTGSAYLTAGTYNLEIVTAFAPGAGVFGINVEFLAPVEPDPDPDPEQPSGNPVIETLPFTYEITTGGENTFDVYYDFTAAADVTLIISRPAGGLVSLSGNSSDWSTDENGNYNLFVPAGETVCLNFWTMSPTTVGSFTVSEQAPAQ